MKDASQRGRVLSALQAAELRRMHVDFASGFEEIPALRFTRASNDDSEACGVSIYPSSCHLSHLASTSMSMLSCVELADAFTHP